MKIKSIFLALITAVFVGNVYAAPNDLISIKTDPVLKDPRSLISVNTDPVLKDPKAMIGIKTDPVLNPRNNLNEEFSLNFQPLLDLLSAIEKAGSKVETKLVESDGLTLLKVKVNGQHITPFILGCEECKIEFEY